MIIVYIIHVSSDNKSDMITVYSIPVSFDNKTDMFFCGALEMSTPSWYHPYVVGSGFARTRQSNVTVEFILATIVDLPVPTSCGSTENRTQYVHFLKSQKDFFF